jgi:branched-chain amino acid aminotransferase group II
VRPAKHYKFLVIASPAGNYFKSGVPAVSIWVSQDYTRAAPGGTGAAKCGGNYAASLVPHAAAVARGFDQVCFLDAAEHQWIEELGGMNVFFAFDDGSLITPPLGGTILPGITRDSLIRLARKKGSKCAKSATARPVARRRRERQLVECFACGTAAVVTPIGRVASDDGEFTVGGGGPGQLTTRLARAAGRHPARRGRGQARMGHAGRMNRGGAMDIPDLPPTSPSTHWVPTTRQPRSTSRRPPSARTSPRTGAGTTRCKPSSIAAVSARGR